MQFVRSGSREKERIIIYIYIYIYIYTPYKGTEQGIKTTEQGIKTTEQGIKTTEQGIKTTEQDKDNRTRYKHNRTRKKEMNTHERSSKWEIRLLPVFTVISSGIACLVAYLVGRDNGNIEPPPFVPYISDTGSLKPQSSWFTLFLVISCYLTYNIICVRYRQVAAKETCLTANKFSYVTGIIFVCGKLVVASFQLSSHKYIHLFGAMAYFVGALIFAISQTYIQYRCSDVTLKLPRKAAIVFWIRIICCTVLFICTIIFSCFTLIPSLKKHNRGGANVGQVTEWIMALLKSVYMLTFLYDFWKIEMTDSMHFSEEATITDATDGGHDFTGVAVVSEKPPSYNRFFSAPGIL